MAPENLASSQQALLKSGGGSGCWRWSTTHSKVRSRLRVPIVEHACPNAYVIMVHILRILQEQVVAVDSLPTFNVHIFAITDAL